MPTWPDRHLAEPRREHPAPVSPDGAAPAPLGRCRFCGDDSWAEDDSGPVHPCCAIHAVENPGQPCLACTASRIARGRWEASRGQPG